MVEERKKEQVKPYTFSQPFFMIFISEQSEQCKFCPVIYSFWEIYIIKPTKVFFFFEKL